MTDCEMVSIGKTKNRYRCYKADILMGKSIFICYIAASKRGRRGAFSAGILFLLRFTWCYVYCSVIDDISFLAVSCVFSLSRVFSRCLVCSRCLMLSSHSSMCFVSSLFRFEFSRRFSLNLQ